MKDTQRKRYQRETILVIHHDAAVLVLVSGILTRHYRILLAADAKSAIRLAMLEDVPIDLVLIGRDTPGVRNSRQLQRRLLAIRPDLSVLSMIGWVKDEVIRLRIVGVQEAYPLNDFVAEIRWALNIRSFTGIFEQNRASAGEPDRAAAKSGAPLTMRAGAIM